MGKVLQVRDLSIGYGDVPLLEEIAFDVQRGQVLAILGASGCGKSTLLRTLIGLQPPLHGRVHFTGIGPPSRAMTPPQFGVLFQSAALFGSSTLLQNVMVPLVKWTDLPFAAAEAVAMGRLRLVGLEPAAHDLPSEVSGGMKKRAGIARAGARSADPVPRRAVGRSRPDDRGRPRSVDPDARAQSAGYHRHGDSRVAQHPAGRRPVHHARPRGGRHHRARFAARPRGAVD
jgi:ABC-type uncharacterized transport system YnjBCD ATPase subunit